MLRPDPDRLFFLLPEREKVRMRVNSHHRPSAISYMPLCEGVQSVLIRIRFALICVSTSHEYGTENKKGEYYTPLFECLLSSPHKEYLLCRREVACSEFQEVDTARNTVPARITTIP